MLGVPRIHNRRLLTYCATTRYEEDRLIVTATPGQLLQSLLLFDHVNVQTFKLRELPGLIEAFGVQPTIELLRSGLLTFSPDFVLFAVDTSSNPVARDLKRVNIIRINSKRQLNLANDIERLMRLMPPSLSRKQIDNLIEAACSTFPKEPPHHGESADEQARRDCLGSSAPLRRAVAIRLRQQHLLAISESDFSLAVHDEGTHVRFETDLGARTLLRDNEVYSAVSLSMAAMAQLAMRVEEMTRFDSISGFRPDELALFQTHMRALLERCDCQQNLAEFERVISVLGLPDVPASGRLDLDAFLLLRESRDCLEFREWLGATGSMDDADIVATVTGFRTTVERYLQGTPGRVARFLLCGAAGFLPTVGPIAGLAFSALDSFLIENVLSRSGAVAFIAHSYPSLFGGTRSLPPS